ncbi:MAG: cation diffusion facilitator family transporter [Acidimicrobiales bacterium]
MSAHDHQDAGHSHGPSLAHAGARHRKRLLVAFLIIGGFFIVEAIAGVISGSLALLSDAGHMLTDVVGLGMALAAIQLAVRHSEQSDSGTAPKHHTFGLYRLEILAAFVNSLLLFGVAFYVLYEAIVRLVGDGREVLGTTMLVVAALGLLANIVVFLILREGSSESLNVEAAYLEVVADTLGSVAVIVAAVIYMLTGWTWVDPVFGAVIGLWILPRTFRLGRRAVRILLQSAPAHIDIEQLEADLESIPDVVNVHDLHVWTLTSQMESVSAHLTAAEESDHHAILDQARQLLAETYSIGHATFQVEPESHVGCNDIDW